MSLRRRIRLHRSAPWLFLPFATLLSLAIAGCAGGPVVLDPASPQSSRIAELFWGEFGVAAVIFLLVEVMLVIAMVRFRSRPGAAEPPQTHGSWPLETAWTVAPAIILAGVFLGTVSTMVAVSENQPGAVNVRVTGHQWWWGIEYPDLNIVTANEMHVPVRQFAKIELLAQDVIHSFWVPRLAGKTDAIPGHTNWVRFTPNESGTYRGQCAEFCGTQHANMGVLVIAEPGEQYDAWVKRMQTPPPVPTTGAAAQGAQAFVTQPCWTCHTVEGTKAQGNVGPNLTHVASRRTIAALTMDNTPENLARWLANPQAVKPGNKMPNLHLSQETIQGLVAYLETLQ